MGARKQVPENIVEIYLGCPYCSWPLASTAATCCGEAGHGEIMFLVKDEPYLSDEFHDQFEIVKEGRDCGCEKTCHCEPESTEER